MSDANESTECKASGESSVVESGSKESLPPVPGVLPLSVPQSLVSQNQSTSTVLLQLPETTLPRMGLMPGTSGAIGRFSASDDRLELEFAGAKYPATLHPSTTTMVVKISNDGLSASIAAVCDEFAVVSDKGTGGRDLGVIEFEDEEDVNERRKRDEKRKKEEASKRKIKAKEKKKGKPAAKSKGTAKKAKPAATKKKKPKDEEEDDFDIDVDEDDDDDESYQ